MAIPVCIVPVQRAILVIRFDQVEGRRPVRGLRSTEARSRGTRDVLRTIGACREQEGEYERSEKSERHPEPAVALVLGCDRRRNINGLRGLRSNRCCDGSGARPRASPKGIITSAPIAPPNIAEARSEDGNMLTYRPTPPCTERSGL